MSDKILKKWEASGLLDGLLDERRSQISKLLERELARIRELNYPKPIVFSAATYKSIPKQRFIDDYPHTWDTYIPEGKPTECTGEFTKTRELVGKACAISRRSFSTFIANELLSVQPMSIPSGLLFYMDHKFEFPKIKNVVPGTIQEMFVDDVVHLRMYGGGGGGGLEKPAAIIADPSRFPHQCPRCSAPAYIGFVSVDCSRKSCS